MAHPLQRHLDRAVKLLGPTAVVKAQPAGKYRDGICNTCHKRGCRRKNYRMIGYVVADLFVHVAGVGHTWKEAWERAENDSRALARKAGA